MSGAETDFTTFLFGNVDEQGNLENDFLDEETKMQLGHLRLFFNTDEDLFPNDAHENERSSSVSSPESKASSAEDFAEIDETAEDHGFSVPDGIPESNKLDSTLHQSSADEDEEESVEENYLGDDELVHRIGAYDDSSSATSEDEIEKPLASMQPFGYTPKDVKRYFPEFRKGKILRFSRLFGPGKPTSVPQIWRAVKSKRRQAATSGEKALQETTGQSETLKQGTSDRADVDASIAPEECETDDEMLLMKPDEPNRRSSKNANQSDKNDLSGVAPWRFGPAAYWYDLMGVPEDSDTFDYGFKLKPESDITEEFQDMFPAEAYLPITCTRWEDNVIFDGEDVRQEVLKMLTSPQQPICGWIPTQQTRTYESFLAMLKSGGFASILSNKNASTNVTTKTVPPPPSPALNTMDPGPNFSIFLPENDELMGDQWLKNVIIDPEAMERIPEPNLLTLDASEDQSLSVMPEDVPKEEPLSSEDNAAKSSSDRKEHQFTKKSQMILGKVAQRQREEEEEAASQMVEKDSYNLSNDEYYLPKGSSTVTAFGVSMIQHSIPAQNLMRPFFPTFLSVTKLRQYHRWPLKRFSRGLLSKSGTFTPVQSLDKHIQKKEKLREQQRLASGGGEMFFMREPDDLTGKDGELILCEYSEEHPPLLMQPGMAAKIKNYYKRKPGKDNIEPQVEYGETAYAHSLPFLGQLGPGESIQALENSLFRAPIYQHGVPETDFLIIRSRHGYYIRTVPTIFCIGQECPTYEVPSPNSKRASNFVRDYLLVFIYRLFWESKEEPRRLRMEDIRQAFPHYAESSIRKRLKLCSDFKRLGPGTEANFWVLRDEFRLPSKEEIRAMVTPEVCCAYFSMLAAEQRLKDAGYGEKYFFTPEDEDDDNDQVKMADEIKCAPWNTTRAFILTMKGKCLLDLTGVADPTGCNEGFSYVRVSAKPPKEDLPPPVKRTVTGTDADLRKLSLKDAKQLLRDFGVKDDEIKSLTRWEIIDVIRTLSTQQARSGGSGITKFARGSMRFSIAEVQERYRQECQRIFDLQNKVLSSTEVFSSDEKESEAEDSDIEEMSKNIETMLTNKRAAMYNSEEKEREELKRLLRGETAATTPAVESRTEKEQRRSDSDKDDEADGRKLKIFRTFRTSDGREHVSVEVVTKPQLIEAYVRIRSTKDEAFIKHFAQMDEQYKVEKRREKRRLQDQLRRIRRNEKKMALQQMDQGSIGGGSSSSKNAPVLKLSKLSKLKKPPPPPKPSLLKMRCSACGGTGHMKTNKNCPLYGKVKLPPQQVALTDEQIEEQLQMPSSAENLVIVEGTKLKLSKVVVEHAEKIKKKSLQLKFPKHVVAPTTVRPSVSKRSSTDIESDERSPSPSMDEMPETPGSRPSLIVKIANPKLIKEKRQHAEYLQDVPRPSVQRRRADPKVTMSVVLEGILNELKALPEAAHFLSSVNKKKVPDYYRIVERPMDLQKIRMNLSKNIYMTREEFLKDVRQMLDNSRLYNGDQHDITQAARTLFEHASRRVAEKEQKLMRLEKAINPLLDDNDQVAFSFILDSIIQQCKNVPKSIPFHSPVDRKKVKTYFEKVRRPMDLGTMQEKCKRNQYHSVQSFERDLELIYKNSELFNGETSTYTLKAKEILDFAKKKLDENSQHLGDLEKNLRETKEKALEAAETDSLVTGTSSVAGDTMMERNLGSPMSDTVPADENSNSLLHQDLQLSEGEDANSSDTFARSRTAPTNFSGLGMDLMSARTSEIEEGSSSRLDLEEGELLDEERGTAGSLGEQSEEAASPDYGRDLAELLDQSEMGRTGRLHTDLAMSDSDGDDDDMSDDDNGSPSPKRPRTFSGDDCDFRTL